MEVAPKKDKRRTQRKKKKRLEEKISLMADRAYKRISEKVAIPKAVRFVQRVVERGRGIER